MAFLQFRDQLMNRLIRGTLDDEELIVDSKVEPDYHE